MPSILIVDDERNIRDGLSVMIERVYAASIPDESPVIVTVSNGEEALQILAARDVDLMITDIMMPVMDGLTLMEEARRRKKDLYVVVLSGLGEFEAARRAIEHGARSYLLKPIDREELTATLVESINHIRTIRSLWEQRIAPLLLPSITNVVKPCFPENLAQFIPGRFIVCTAPHEARRDLATVSSKKRRIVEAIRRADGTALVSYITTPFVVALCREDGKETVETERFLSATEDHAVGIGPPVVSPAELSFAYRKTVDAFTRALLTGADERVVWSDQSFDPTLDARDLDWLRRVVRIAFDRHSTEPARRIHQIVTDGIDGLAVVNRSPFFVARAMTTEIIRSAPVDSVESLRSDPALVRLSDATGYRRVADFTADIVTLVQQLHDLHAAPDTESDTPASQKIKTVLDWIRERYSDPALSMTEAAESVGMGYSYFSKRFSEVTGSSFVRYVQDTRIDAAKRLLLTTDKTVAEIASAVGFTDRKKFSRLFRERVGVVPVDFRRSS